MSDDSDRLKQEKKGGAKFQWSQKEAEKPERAIVIVPDFTRIRNYSNKDSENIADSSDPAHARTLEARVEEAVGLAHAISLDVVDTITVALKVITPATLFGSGKVSEIGERIESQEIGLAIVDGSLSPVQQQKLEKAWDCKVLDRTALILEIFGARAQTKEGRLQVELAHLNYQKGRLVRTWTHLERQRGALGFIGGPGETQIEADRRQIRDKIKRLERELEKVRKTRDLHRSKRKKVPFPVVALVGYTNAGKSSLFNHLTGSQVFAKDLLFATLDPTLRQLDLPEGTKVILSDTVGFVSNLPTHLVAAFRATLEEVVEAELIIHVQDISSPDHVPQARDVEAILSQLGIECEDIERILEVWNKIDLIEEEALASIKSTRNQTGKAGEPVLISAITGEGCDTLLERIEEKVTYGQGTMELHLPIDQLSAIPTIYEATHIIDRTDNEDGSVSLIIRQNTDNTTLFNRYLVK